MLTKNDTPPNADTNTIDGEKNLTAPIKIKESKRFITRKKFIALSLILIAEEIITKGFLFKETVKRLLGLENKPGIGEGAGSHDVQNPNGSNYRKPGTDPSQKSTTPKQSENNNNKNQAPLRIEVQRADELFYFLDEIKNKNLPIDPINAQKFGEEVLKLNAPKGFLERLSKNMNYLSKDDYYALLKEMLKKSQTIISRDKWYTIFTKKIESSNQIIYDWLIKNGLIPSSEIADTYDESSIRIIDNSLNVYIDDFAISGSQAIDLLRLIKKSDAKNLRIRFIFLMASQKGISKIMNYSKVMKLNSIPSIEVISPNNIRPLTDDLTPEDIHFLASISPIEDIFMATYDNGKDLSVINSPFFWGWRFVPDNLPGAFLGKGKVPMLLDPAEYSKHQYEPL